PALAVYVGSETAGTFGPYQYRLPIHEPLARAILEQGIERGFDLVYTQGAKLDYAFYVPLHFTMPEPRVPIVPLHVNVYLPPQPTPRRCYEWGVALGEMLRARPERVALMASGGMSHFPGTDRYASPDVDHDRRLLDRLQSGRGREMARVTAEELDKTGTWSCGRGSRCSAQWVMQRPTCTVTSPPGTTATRSWSGRYERGSSLSVSAGPRLPAQPLSLRDQVRSRILRALSCWPSGCVRGYEPLPDRAACARDIRSRHARGTRWASVPGVHGR